MGLAHTMQWQRAGLEATQGIMGHLHVLRSGLALLGIEAVIYILDTVA